MADTANLVAQPGASDLDAELSGLLITRVTVSRTSFGTADVRLNFNITAASGWCWSIPGGERPATDWLLAVELKLGHRNAHPEHKPLVDAEVRLLEGWMINRIPLSLCMAPGKWSRLFDPATPDHNYARIPRSGQVLAAC